MNNSFELKRFLNYATMNYWCKRKQYITTIVAAIVILLTSFCQFEFNSKAITWGGFSVDNILDRFTFGFNIAFIIFTIAFVRISMRGINGRSITMQDILIPVSTFERFLFTILNSTVVATLLFLLIFQITSSYAESLYMIGSEGYMYKGLLGSNAVWENNTEKFTQPIDVTLKYIFENNSLLTLLWGAPYLALVAIIMWGEVTFRGKYSLVLNLAILIAINLILGNILAPFAEFTQTTGSLRIGYDTPFVFVGGDPFFTFLLFLPPITYLWVTWKKLKSIQPEAI